MGPNGCGETSLYRALSLLAAAAEGRFALTLAEEGGMPSEFWAGERSKDQAIRRVRKGMSTDYSMVSSDSHFFPCTNSSDVPSGVCPPRQGLKSKLTR